ncbi:hypothetical protein BGZ95_000253 [Linnemannia exigua]|uniref:Uncharacterized protein n=1 Tax=Linnemannia exigua TaxID=604196 RepID=A0AAD4D8I5_9FUNG|nr:hypothetical protein BGZ95_000253 [Linnemannia exigua]
MGQETISTHTLKSDAVTTIIARTTTIVSEHEEVIPNSREGVIEGVKKTLRDYWFPTSHGSDDEDDNNEDHHHGHAADQHQHDSNHHHATDPSLFGSNSVMRRAYDYWKSLTKDAEETAKDMVTKAKEARDEAAKEAKWAMFGYKKEAREAYEAAEEKYRQALAAAEKVHEDAHERARSRWFHQADCTQKEVGEEAKDAEEELTHKKWDRFKAAVDSLAFNPPKYACSPSSQYWFSRQNPAADSGWDCREIWDHPSHNDHGHSILKSLPKKELSVDKVHGTLTGLLAQARLKAKNSPSATSFETSLKSVKDSYQALLDRVARNEKGAVDELDSFVDKVKAKLNEAKYFEEQTDSWLTSQWNAVIDNAGDTKDQYERVFKNALKGIKKTRNEIYNSLSNGLFKSVQTARSNIREALRLTKDDVDKSRLHKALRDASQGFTNTLKETEAKIKAVPKQAYDSAVESFNRDTAQVKAKLEHAAEAARKSGSSISRHASKSVSSVIHDAKKSADSIKNKASSKYDRATASVSSIWGSATNTPFAPLTKVQDSYHQMLGDAKTNLFGHHGHNSGSHHDANSLYGALTALYLMYLARKIWLRRNACKSWKTTHGDLHLTRHGASDRRQSNSSESSHEHHEHHEHHELHGKHGKHKHHDDVDNHRVATHSHSHGQHSHHSKHGHTNSFGAILTKYTSIFPLTMILLTILELAGFSRVGLHTLFTGLITSQLLQCGFFNNLMEQLGILDHSLGEGVSIRAVREMAHCLSWTVFGLTIAANAIKVLHDGQH